MATKRVYPLVTTEVDRERAVAGREKENEMCHAIAGLAIYGSHIASADAYLKPALEKFFGTLSGAFEELLDVLETRDQEIRTYDAFAQRENNND